MRRIIFCLTVCLFSACAGSAPPRADNTGALATTNAPTNASAPAAGATPAQMVRASAPPLTMRAGGAAEAEVRLQIADGYHVNANPASFPYLKATEVELVPAAGVTAGKPVYPPPVTRKFHFAPQPLAVYEGEATIRLPLKARADAPKGAQNLRARVHVQACDEEKCFPPTTIETDIPVTIS